MVKPRANKGTSRSRPAKRGAAAPTTRRGAPEAIEKRVVARAINTMFGAYVSRLRDGRTARKLTRLLAEFEEGSKQGMKPVETLSRVALLMELGETVESLSKLHPLPPPRKLDAATAGLVVRLDATYGFPLGAYAFLGIRAEGVMGRRRRRRRAAT